MPKYVYRFSEGNMDQKDLLGGKGANLAEMAKIGLPVPPGFTITTEACRAYMRDGEVPPELRVEVTMALREIEDAVLRTETEDALSSCELLQLDHMFHYAVGRAARSALLAAYQHHILEGVAVAVHEFLASQDRLRFVADLHRRTFEAIRSGDLEAVDAVMDEHLGHLERVAAEL